MLLANFAIVVDSTFYRRLVFEPRLDELGRRVAASWLFFLLLQWRWNERSQQNQTLQQRWRLWSPKT
jgi:hypothetical protein